MSKLPAPPLKLGMYIPHADERLMEAAPAIVDAQQPMYLMGYVLQRDLDALRSLRARLEQELEQVITPQ